MVYKTIKIKQTDNMKIQNVIMLKLNGSNIKKIRIKRTLIITNKNAWFHDFRFPMCMLYVELYQHIPLKYWYKKTCSVDNVYKYSTKQRIFF